jgi:hypothetical protein
VIVGPPARTLRDAKKTFPTPAELLAALDPFLKALPEGFRYAVERDLQPAMELFAGIADELTMAERPAGRTAQSRCRATPSSIWVWPDGSTVPKNADFL